MVGATVIARVVRVVVNHDFRFIFVHIPKTGGTSVRTALLTLRGSIRNPVAATKHATTDDAAAFYQAEGRSLDGYGIVAFVRNPWDRLTSLHRFLSERAIWQKRGLVPATFPEFVALLEERETWLEQLKSIRPQADYIGEHSARIGRYETLADDFESFCSALGVRLRLPHLKPTRPDGFDYRTLYTDHTAEIVAKRYSLDVERFGYRFDDPSGPTASTGAGLA